MKDPFIIQEDKVFFKKPEFKKYSFYKNEGEEWPGGEGDQPRGKIIDSSRARKILIIVFLGLLILMGRLFFLQINKGSDYRQVAEGNRIRIEEIKADRGLIYDRNKKLLVENIPNFILTIIPSDLPKEKEDLNRILDKVSEIAGPEVRDKIEETIKEANLYSYQPIIVEENIDFKELILLNVEGNNLPGIKVEVEKRRKYIDEPSLSPVLGYLGRITREEWPEKKNLGYSFDDYIGRTGIELYYEDLLKGEKGKKQVEVDSTGREKDILNQDDSQPGSDLVLTIDLDLQKKLAESLKKNIRVAGAQKGAAIAMDPESGEVLAMVSFPDFESNKFIGGLSSEEYQKLSNNPNQPLFFRAISGEYPPGSTIKLLIGLAALEEKVITPNTLVNSVGGIKIDQWFFPDWKAGGHGLTDIRKALAESVNTFFYFIGGGYKDFVGLGIDRIVRYLKIFNLGQKTGIDLPGEQAGFVPSPQWKEEVKKEEWYIGDTYHLSIGQGDILVTPLQISNFTAMIANGGTIYKPHLVKEIINKKLDKIEEKESKIIKTNFTEEKNIKVIQQGLRDSVLSGSSRAMADLPVKVAGKTGTAQMGNNQRSQAWFTCYAPYDHPEIILTILVENGGEGSVAALPVAKEVLYWYFNRNRP